MSSKVIRKPNNINYIQVKDMAVGKFYASSNNDQAIYVCISNFASQVKILPFTDSLLKDGWITPFMIEHNQTSGYSFYEINVEIKEI